MKTPPIGHAIQIFDTSLGRQWRLFDLFRTATTPMLIRTGIAVAAAWIPLVALCAARGGAAFLSFLTDYASQSRFLIVLSVLILAEPPLQRRHYMVANHFEDFIVPQEQRSQFQAAWSSHERARCSKLGYFVLLLLTYATAMWLSQYLSPGGSEFVSWWIGGGGFKSFSPAGMWGFFVSYPILGYFALLWLWRQVLWARFLRSTSLLNLRLIAAHPDHMGGLSFLETSMMGQLPFTFCLGVGLAGAVANRVLNEGYPLSAFRFWAPVLVAAALLVSVAPYFLFTRTLMSMRRRGILRYGAFARAVGEQFEKKWLDQTNSLNEDVLNVPDFSTTTDLYGVVGNIDEIRIIPVGLVNLYAVIIVTLIPAIPLLIASIPLGTLMRAAMKMLF